MKKVFPRIAVHTAALLPFLFALYAALTGGLSVNPIEDLTRRCGDAALYLLMATLSFTPISIIFGGGVYMRFRRTAGLYTFWYAFTHFMIVIGLDYGFNIDFIIEGVVKKPFIIVGASALLLITTRMVTSYQWGGRITPAAIRGTGFLVYPAAGLAVTHYLWLAKNSKGAPIERPIAWAIILAILFVIRMPAVRGGIEKMRGKV